MSYFDERTLPRSSMRGCRYFLIFDDFDQSQTFALRPDEILGNERQMVVRRFRASAASKASACNSILRADHAAGLRDPTLHLDRPPSRAIEI